MARSKKSHTAGLCALYTDPLKGQIGNRQEAKHVGKRKNRGIHSPAESPMPHRFPPLKARLMAPLRTSEVSGEMRYICRLRSELPRSADPPQMHHCAVNVGMCASIELMLSPSAHKKRLLPSCRTEHAGAQKNSSGRWGAAEHSPACVPERGLPRATRISAARTHVCISKDTRGISPGCPADSRAASSSVDH